jgi:hypothetical protein
VRAALQRAADRAKKSVSQYAEHLLKVGLKKPTHTHQLRNQALGQAIACLAENIEGSTGKSWREDPFAGQALTHAVSSLLQKFTPTTPEQLEPPMAVEVAAARMPTEFAQLYRTAAGHGYIAAHAMIAELESAGRTGPPNEWSVPINLQFPDELAHHIGRDLMLTKRSKGT